MPHQPWDTEKRDIILGRLAPLWIDSGIPGTNITSATLPSMPMPVGTVWWRFTEKNKLSILWSFVVDPLRRCGIRTYIHEQMRLAYPTCVFTTNEGNRLSTPWLKKMGFTRGPHCWALPPKAAPKRRAARRHS